MKSVACHYAVVQFLPYTETGEFVNAGLVMVCPQSGYFGYRLQRRKVGRVTGFFNELPAAVYRQSMQLIESELRRIEAEVRAAPDWPGEAGIRMVFEKLVHPREAIVRFGPSRVILTQDPAAELDVQFERYVNRSFATAEYVEQTMEKRIRGLLNTLRLDVPFKARRIGNDEVYARFALVQCDPQTEAPRKVIKPLNLAQTEPMGIYDHGDAWLQKIRRLRSRKLLPDAVLIAVSAPQAGDTKRLTAFREICDEFETMGVRTIPESDQQKISDFARN